MRVIGLGVLFMAIGIVGAGSAAAQEEAAAVLAQDVSIEGEGFALPATLELPAGNGPMACAVFISGSGPTDRNWNSDMFPASGRNGSAQQLAEALREQGVGSVRYDKLGSGANRENLEQLSMQRMTDEVVAAYHYVAAQERCGRIFLIGNSEGVIHGLQVAEILQGDPDWGGLVAMSGPSRSMIALMLEQIRAQSQAAGFTEEQIAGGLAALQAGVDGLPATVGTPPDFSAMPDLAQFWTMISHSGPPDLLHDLMTLDPLAAATNYRGPILVLSADHDVQVPVSDGDAIFAAVPDAGQVRQRVTIANADHVYKQEDRTAADADPQALMMAYWEVGRPLAPGVVDTIVGFIHTVAP